jgi:uncharacterized protein
MYLQRSTEPTLRKLIDGYPVIVLTGPRQSGKTTLVRHVFEDMAYVSLEEPDQREFAHTDPRGFLGTIPKRAILDEVQRAPDLLSYIQSIVDQEQDRARYILTGSQQFGLLSTITQSLAGRAALVRLLPFSLGELQGHGRTPDRLEDLLWQGLYPPIHDRGLEPDIWYSNYVNTYLERDVRQMVNVRDLSTFQRFLRMCASRTGQLLNLSSLATDCGITHNTAKAWISVLEAGYIVHLLLPHHANFGKRLIKTPKLYFLDPGLASWLLGIQRPDQLATHPMRGPLFETWVVSELLKARFNQGKASNLFFWRDRTGHEVDVLIDTGSGLIPVEIKSGATITNDFFSGLRFWQELSGGTDPAILVYGGDQEQQRSGTRVIPWRHVVGNVFRDK